MAKKAKGKKSAEVLIVTKPQGMSVSPSFMEALLAFQYGDSLEESNAGFEKMMEIAAGDEVTESKGEDPEE